MIHDTNSNETLQYIIPTYHTRSWVWSGHVRPMGWGLSPGEWRDTWRWLQLQTWIWPLGLLQTGATNHHLHHRWSINQSRVWIPTPLLSDRCTQKLLMMTLWWNWWRYKMTPLPLWSQNWKLGERVLVHVLCMPIRTHPSPLRVVAILFQTRSIIWRFPSLIRLRHPWQSSRSTYVWANSGILTKNMHW